MNSLRIQISTLAICSALALTGASSTWAAQGDYNGDGMADILWRHNTSGQNLMFLMNGANVISSQWVPAVTNTQWKVAGSGDYNGDGYSDILWRNSSTGQNLVFLMNGATVNASEWVPTVSDLQWQIVGSGDYNGDGNSDILWRHAVTGRNLVFLMDGSTVATSAYVPAISDLQWQVAGSGDYNGDGNSDILWRNGTTGRNLVFLMVGATVIASEWAPTVSDLQWQVVGSGDYNGDGMADILWRHNTSGQNLMFLMNGANVISSQWVPAVTNTQWQVAGSGDYNGDGRADILWRNKVTGQNRLYLMDGASIVNSLGVSTVADTSWQIVGNDIAPPVDSGSGLDGHFKWRVPLAGDFSLVRPAVGPDGSVYAVDVDGNLVAVAPNGAMRWMVANAGRKGVATGPDGTIYTGDENFIKAFTPNGGLKWTFAQTPSAHVFHDVAVGPDGHVYGLASSGMGVFSLEDTANGPVLRWANPEPFVRLYMDYTELAFGPTADGQDQQLYFNVNGHVRAIRLSDGASIFTAFGLSVAQRPQVSPLDGTWHFGDAAYSAADGSNIWTFDFGTAATGIQPALGQSGIHYTISQGQILFAINPGGTGRFATPLDEPVGVPDVDPNETMLLLPTSSSFTHASGLKTVRTSNGSDLWRIEFPPDPNGNRQHVNSPVAFTADGATGYVMTTTASGVFPNATYLNAINLDPAIPSASTQLRSTNIEMSTRSQGQAVRFTGVVTVLDENRQAVSGATVSATWTLPDNSTVSATATTNNSGDATFEISGDGGMYWLDIDDIAKASYTFDPSSSILSAGIIGF